MMLKTILDIEGMTCDHCVSSVTKILENFSGVTEVTVSLEENTATVSHDELKTTPSEMSKAIENDGYTVKSR
ncbi:MAG: cation transporter [Nitrospirota bacterium]|nr:cation transporter [Nitrospirota bacterium]